MRSLIIDGVEYIYYIYNNGFTINFLNEIMEYKEPHIPNKFLSYEENAKNIIYNRLGKEYHSKDLIKHSEDITESQLTIMEAMATQYEENLENQIIQMDVLATIYETQLESMEGVE